MADFHIAFRRTLGFEDDPRHPGVVTPEPHGARARLGINSTAHPELPDDFWTCEYKDALEMAERVYWLSYWGPLKLDYVNSQDIANKVFDMAVNMGKGTAAKMMQHAAGTKEDGVVGAATIGGVNAGDPATILTYLRDASERHYVAIVDSNPEEYGRWKAAWIERARR